MVKLDLKRFSQERVTIMGAAMLLIIWFHCGIDVEGTLLLKIFKDMSDIGVDIFFLMSGLGIAFSLEKNGNVKEFFKRRALRILPVYFVISVPWFILSDLILSKGNITAFLLDITTLSFWLSGKLSVWFIAAILFLYILSPFYYELLKRKPMLNVILMISIFIISCIIRLTPLAGGGRTFTYFPI